MPQGCGARRALRRSAGGVPGAPAEGRPDGERRRSARVPDDAENFPRAAEPISLRLLLTCKEPLWYSAA